MNNYYNYQNYLNQAKQYTNMNQPQKSQNKNTINPSVSQPNKLYDPYNGFIRGNMFPSLYSPYKIEKPYDIKPMNEQAEMLTHIDSLGFAMLDLNLYLDLYPNDRQYIDLYNQYRMQREDIQKQYEEKFGPLVTSSEALIKYPWAWDNKPWPWQNR